MSEPVNMMVPGWMEPWVRNLAEAKVLVFERQEALVCPVDDQLLRELVLRKLGQMIQRHLEYVCETEGLLVLAQHGQDYLRSGEIGRRVRAVVMKKAALPPQQDWDWVFG